MRIETESSNEYAAVEALVTEAFGGRDDESNLVAVLRGVNNFDPTLSLVARDDGNVVGHILFSRVDAEAEGGDVPGVVLAPVAVTPARQGERIGSELVREGLERCRTGGHRFVVLHGSPEYYHRFGFRTAAGFGLENPFPTPEEEFMALELEVGALDGATGPLRYPAAFEEI